MTKTLSIVIPVYNERQTIAEVLKKVREVDIGKLKKEIIIVDDGSTDGSREEIVKQKKLDPLTTKVHLSLINLGKGAAVRIGLKFSTGNYIIIQDADLELDPAEYKKILKPILLGKAKVVYGSRFLGNKNKNISLRTRLGNLGLTWLTNILYGSNLTDMETAYKAFSRDVIEDIRLRALEFELEPEITARILQRGYKIHEVAVKYQPRSAEEGKKLRITDGLEALYTLLQCKWRKG